MEMRKIIILFLMIIVAQAYGIITQLDTENADRNITSTITVLTDTPDASNPMLCQGLVYFGDGTKDLDGTGGNFELTITVGGQTIQPSPQIVTFGTEIRSSVWTSQFTVPANVEVILKVKSPNAADTDVDITAYLYDVFPANVSSGIIEADMIQVSGDTSAADNLEAMYDGTGYNDNVAPSTQIQVSTLAGGISVTQITESSTVTEGSETNTHTATQTHDSVYYIITDDGNGPIGIDMYLQYDTGSSENLPVEFHMHGYYTDGGAPFTNTCTIEAYNWSSEVFQVIATMTHATSDEAFDLPLTINNVGINGNDGKVRIRFAQTAQEGSSTLNIDHATIGYVSGGLTVADIVDGNWNALLTGSTYNIGSSAGRRLRDVSSPVILTGIVPDNTSTSTSIKLNGDASDTDGAYDPATINVIAGTGLGQSRSIWEYDGGDNRAYINREWKEIPDDTSEYVIVAYAGEIHVNEGVATGGGPSTITLNVLADSKDDIYVGQIIFIGAGIGQDGVGVILSYDGDTKIATMQEPWATEPTAGSMYAVLPNHVHALAEIMESMFTYDAIAVYGTESGSVVNQIADNASGGIPSDMYTDITTTPWQEVYHEISNTSNEYYRDNLYTASGIPIISADLKIGKRVRE